jgi:hypothetical protein
MRRAFLGGPSVPKTATSQRLSEWRDEIVRARIRLAESPLPPLLERELWTIVDCREACIKLSGADFHVEMELVDREIEAALRPRKRAS